MGVVSDFVGGLFGGGGSDYSLFNGLYGGSGANAVPKAPPIPEPVQPSAIDIQRAREFSKARSTYLGRTRGGTKVLRATLLGPSKSTSTYLGGS